MCASKGRYYLLNLLMKSIVSWPLTHSYPDFCKTPVHPQICVFPVFIMGLMYWSGVQFGQLPRLTGFIVVWLVISNSAINPIIYGLLNNNFRAVYVAMIKKWCRRSASSFRKQAKNVSTVSTGGNVSQNVSNVNNTQASTLEEQDLMNSKKDEEHKT